MHVSKSVFAFTLYVASIHLAAAAPVNSVEDAAHEVEIRTPPVPGSSKLHPIQATMDVNDNNALPFDADCYAILCLEKEPLFQRDSSESKDNRKDAGTKKTYPGGSGTGPFRNPAKADVKIPGNQYVSPEEFPYASTTQGGHQAFLFPVSESSQDSQGGAINSFYSKHHIQSAQRGQNTNSWYKITDWSGQRGPYCEALHKNKGEPNKNDPICKKGSNDGKGKWGFDVGEYAYYYDGHSFHKAKDSK